MSIRFGKGGGFYGYARSARGIEPRTAHRTSGHLRQELAGHGRRVVPVRGGKRGHGRGHVPRRACLGALHRHRGAPHQAVFAPSRASRPRRAGKGAGAALLRPPQPLALRVRGRQAHLHHGGLPRAGGARAQGHALPPLQGRGRHRIQRLRPRDRPPHTVRVPELLPRGHGRYLQLQVGLLHP